MTCAARPQAPRQQPASPPEEGRTAGSLQGSGGNKIQLSYTNIATLRSTARPCGSGLGRQPRNPHPELLRQLQQTVGVLEKIGAEWQEDNKSGGSDPRARPPSPLSGKPFARWFPRAPPNSQHNDEHRKRERKPRCSDAYRLGPDKDAAQEQLPPGRARRPRSRCQARQNQAQARLSTGQHRAGNNHSSSLKVMCR